ncbi:MAG: hypothetical protein ACHQ0J_01895 [Candidatus Dormibacterales bacterium]
MVGSRRLRLVAAACCGLLTVASCAGPTGQPATPTGPAAIAGAFSDQSVAALGQAFATEGVGTYDSDSSSAPLWPITSPASPLKVLRWQLRAMALEASTSGGGGTTGASLDLLHPAAQDQLPVSYLMAGYVTWGGTPGSRLVAALMGPQDWQKPDGIAFPTLAVMMMVADVSRAAGNPPAGSPVVAAPPSGGGNICTTLANWVAQVIDSIFNALTVGQSNNSFLNILGSIWNAGVGLLEQAVKQAVGAFTAAVVGLITGIVTAIGVGAMVISFLQNLKLTSTASPPFNRYSAMPGTVTFTLGSPGGFDWPPDLVACASAVGLDLQSLNARNNDKVTWSTTGIPPFAQVTSEDKQLDSNNSATFSYLTGNENVTCGSKAQADDIIRVTIKVQRSERDKVKSFIQAFFDAQLAKLGQVVVTVVGPALHALLSGIFNELAQVVDPTAQRFVRIAHTPPSPCPSATPSPSSRASPTTSSVFCSILFPIGVPADLQHQVTGTTPEGLPESACTYGPGPNMTPSQEVATAQLVLYPSAAAARSAFDQGMSALGATRLSGIGDEAALTTLDCQMPTDNENQTQPGQCGAVVKGAKLVFIASRLGAGQVTSLLRIAASHM